MDAMAREINKLKLREVRYLQQIQEYADDCIHFSSRCMTTHMLSLRGVAARALSSTNPATPRTSSQ
eukprot:760081-Hanusia_phi.AAC.3